VVVEVLMPKLGMTMEQGKLVEWSRTEKEAVQKGDIICIIETDKVTYEVESPATGLLLILAEPADNILVGTLLGYIVESEAEYEDLRKAKSSGGEPAEIIGIAATEPKKLASTINEGIRSPIDFQDGKRRASPAARALARKKGISLVDCDGTGPNGRITAADIKQALAGKPAEAPSAEIPDRPERIEATAGARKLAKEKGINLSAISGTGPNGSISRRDVIHALKADTRVSPSQAPLSKDFKGKRLLKEEPMSTIRYTISRRMMESLENSAQMTAFSEWDVTNLMRMRKLLNSQTEKEGYKVSFPGLMVFLLARVLQEMPLFNASVEGKTIRYWQDVNIGVAVAVGDNLVVPVVHGAERRSLKEIQLAVNDLIDRARNKKLLPDDMSGGTFTLSNVGSYGSQWETVILNPPEAALLGIGAIEKKPVAINDEVVIRKMMPISLTFDHRIIDGATAGAFRNRMKTLVEHPEMLITCFPEDRQHE